MPRTRRQGEGTVAGVRATITEARLPDGRVLKGGPGVDLWLDGAPVESFQDAPTKDEWYTPWGGPPEVRSLSVSPEGVVFVNVHVGGILRSRDACATWDATIDLHADVHQVLALGSGRVLAACGDGGLASSRDDGETWHMATAGLRAAYCRAVAVAGDEVFISASRGPGGQDSADYRRGLDDDEAPFEVVVDGLSGNVDSGMLVVGGDGRTIQYSSDRKTWRTPSS